MKKNFTEEQQKFKPKVVIEESDINAMLSMMAFNNERALPVVSLIVERKWVLGLNQTGIPHYTSDTPVNLEVIGPTDDGVGLVTPNARIVFPVTKSHILIITERLLPISRRNSRHGDSCEVRRLAKRDVVNYNRLQAVQSSRYVYCQSDEFEMVRSLCEADPSIRDPKPSKACIRVGPEKVEGNEIRQTIESVWGTRDYPGG
jgi:Protein of unknown function (DUF4238)